MATYRSPIRMWLWEPLSLNIAIMAHAAAPAAWAAPRTAARMAPSSIQAAGLRRPALPSAVGPLRRASMLLVVTLLSCFLSELGDSQRALDGSFVPDLLQPLYEWNINQHTSNHYLSRVRHATLTSTGAVVIQNGVMATNPGEFGRGEIGGIVRVQSMDSPKETCQQVCSAEGLCTSACTGLPGRAPLKDVLTARPTAERPAIAEIMVPLTSANFGHNRVHAFAHVSPLTCESVERQNATVNATYIEQVCTPPYDDMSGALSAVLAPLSSSHTVLRNVELRPLSQAGEWQEILGDFYLLPEELGSGANSITLFVRLGSPLATVGSVSLTDLTVTEIPFTNVALSKTVVSRQVTYNGIKSAASSNAAQDATGRTVTVGNAQLTNGVTVPDTEETWFFVDTSSPPVTIEFELDLAALSFACSVQVAWVENGHISDWSFLLSSTAGDADDFTAVVQVNTANAGSRILVGETDQHWFPCVGGARRAKLLLAKTDNRVFMLTEIAVHGYVETVYGMCQTRCRHGGRCIFAQDPVCECVQKWGWRGPDCNTDVNECSLQEGDAIAAALDIVPPYGGCGQGDVSTSLCNNQDGAFTCSCVSI